MNNKTIFLVMAQYDHEGADVVRCFECEKDAELFAATCNNYQNNCPPTSPDIKDPDDEWDKYWEALDNYMNDHPAGRQFTEADSFYYHPATLYRK